MNYLHYTYKNTIFLIVNNYPSSIQIRNSYKIWNMFIMLDIINFALCNEGMKSKKWNNIRLLVEWYNHNISYRVLKHLYERTKSILLLKMLVKTKDIELSHFYIG